MYNWSYIIGVLLTHDQIYDIEFDQTDDVFSL